MSDRIVLLVKSSTELSKHLPFTFSLCVMYRLLKMLGIITVKIDVFLPVLNMKFGRKWRTQTTAKVLNPWTAHASKKNLQPLKLEK